MKKYLILLSLSLILTACSNEEPEVTTESGDSEEVARLKEENEELKRQQAEQSKDQETEDEQTEEKSETSKDEEDSASADDTDSETSERSSLNFDIDSPEVQAYINKNDNYDDEGNFIQDAISIGMSQTEVEDLYGTHDFIIPSPSTEAAAIYENIAVIYEERGPYIADTNSNINPDNNRVERVLYFPNMTTEEILNAMGTPDQQLANVMGTQNYIYEGDRSNDEWGTVILSEHETPEGLKIGPLSVSNDELSSNSDSTSNASNDSDIDYEMIEAAVSGYMYRLEPFYNYDEYPDILQEIQENSPAYEKLVANKESGNFADHTTYDVDINLSSIMENGMVLVDASRLYSHVNSNGQRVSRVHYIVDPETNKIIDFEAVSDEAY